MVKEGGKVPRQVLTLLETAARMLCQAACVWQKVVVGDLRREKGGENEGVNEYTGGKGLKRKLRGELLESVRGRGLKGKLRG